MATWEEQEAPPEKEIVPPCVYLVRVGQKPDFVGRSNILPYTKALAARSHEWRALEDRDGVPIAKLPPMGPSGGINAGLPGVPKKPSVVGAPTDIREIKVFDAFGQAGLQDKRADGVPNVRFVREVSGIEDITGPEVTELWEKYQEAEGK